MWRAARRLWRRLPLGDAARERLKARFYALYGRLFPDSPRYRVYQAMAASRAAPASRRWRQPGPTVEGDPTGPRRWDVLVFPVVDWEFRRQRPQQLSLQLARAGHRVFYFETGFAAASGWRPEPRAVADGVWVVRLPCRGAAPVFYEQALTERQVDSVLAGLAALDEQVGMGPTVSIVDHPFWFPVAERLANNAVVYDCMDRHGAFPGAAPFVEELETDSLGRADLVVASSDQLASRVAGPARRAVLLRNGVDVEHFGRPAEPLALADDRPVAGYVGALAEWFDAELLVDVARRLLDVDFHLVGHRTGVDAGSLAGLPNVQLHDEVSYEELPRWLAAFDVGLIPFAPCELTLATNPVKLYEYLAAGKPVVATPLPEVAALEPLVATAATADAFAAAILAALRDDAPQRVEQRRAFASENTWELRGEQLARELASLFPKVSVVVLTHDELELTRVCLESLERYTEYPDWELVLVDNGSTDGTVEFLRSWADRRDHVTLLANAENRGFPAGANQGAAAARGELLVFLNNDTVVTRGWLGDLVAHVRRAPGLGALGPVTNNIANEARVELAYRTLDEMHAVARAHTTARRGLRRELAVAAFFCVLIPRRVWEAVGPLDERFGLGLFEDDDYAMRLAQAGYEIACAEDVFVHHHLSASFDRLDESHRHELFLTNKRLWEEKWGPWTPHRGRSAGARQTAEGSRA